MAITDFLILAGIFLAAFLIARFAFLRLRKRAFAYPIAAGIGVFVITLCSIFGALFLYAMTTFTR